MSRLNTYTRGSIFANMEMMTQPSGPSPVAMVKRGKYVCDGPGEDFLRRGLLQRAVHPLDVFQLVRMGSADIHRRLGWPCATRPPAGVTERDVSISATLIVLVSDMPLIYRAAGNSQQYLYHQTNIYHPFYFIDRVGRQLHPARRDPSSGLDNSPILAGCTEDNAACRQLGRSKVDQQLSSRDECAD